MNPNQNPQDDKPAAFDTQGRPLYLRPDTTPQKQPADPTHPEELQVVQVTRSADPVAVTVPPEIQVKHEASRRKYPKLNLSAGEYVILDIRRHPIGLISIWVVALFLASLIIGIWWFVLSHPGTSQAIVPPASVGSVSAFTAGLLVLVGLFAWVAAIVYRGNIFILTNESVIQRVQTSLISQTEKTINLENVKDARFEQAGLLQFLIGYGSIHLTTEGDQDNYTFLLVAKPKEQIAVINNVIEAVKYGRPVEDALKSVVA